MTPQRERPSGELRRTSRPAPLQWIEDRATVVCRGTGTSAALPPGATVERIDDRSLLATAGADGGQAALLARQTTRADPQRDLAQTWALLHRQVAGRPLDGSSVRAEVRAGSLAVGGRAVVDYRQGDDPRRYRFGWLSVERNGATCQLAALEPTSDEAPSGLVAAIVEVTDAPGLAIVSPHERLPGSDPFWTGVAETVEGVLEVARFLATFFR
jgi:hypothetical protein